ncbi:MAG: cell division protein FtsZ [Paludibacteraceae bacterium]|nr:cell division protein FtsZ [Paludibacteraceae bacterium]
MTDLTKQYIMADKSNSIIKVVGVGGGGGNAVNHMYNQGIEEVSFVVCNTDQQALIHSPVPNKILIGEGLGAGNKPSVALAAAEASHDEIRKMLDDGTKMVFITAGMGGGTGTGAAPFVASIARELGILTVGIVTIPFLFEGKRKIRQALKGVAAMSDNVDALLVIHNERLCSVYPDLELSNAFGLADNVLTSAARGIVEIITIDGHINVDFADVCTIMRNGGVAIMNSGYGEGENRVTAAINDALDSPLLNNNDIHKSKKILLNFYCSQTNPVVMSEVGEINDFMAQMGDDIEVIWGVTFDDELGDKVKVTLLATGSEMSVVPEDLREELRREREEAAKLGKNSEDDDNADTEQSETTRETSKYAWQSKKPVDLMDDFKNQLYGTSSKDESKVSISLDQIDDDDEMLRYMETVPAIKRN